MTRIIKVKKSEVKQLQGWLNQNTAVEDAGREEVLKTYTAKFSKSIEADIKVCNSESGPFIDAVIFINGCDSGCLEPSYRLLGSYFFWIGKKKYSVRLEKGRR